MMHCATAPCKCFPSHRNRLFSFSSRVSAVVYYDKTESLPVLCDSASLYYIFSSLFACSLNGGGKSLPKAKKEQNPLPSSCPCLLSAYTKLMICCAIRFGTLMSLVFCWSFSFKMLSNTELHWIKLLK